MSSTQTQQDGVGCAFGSKPTRTYPTYGYDLHRAKNQFQINQHGWTKFLASQPQPTMKIAGYDTASRAIFR